MSIPTWRALPRRVRRDVFRFARYGRPHPDPAVARAAVAWARPWRRRGSVVAPLWFLPVMLVAVSPIDALPDRYQNSAHSVRFVAMLVFGLGGLLASIGLAVQAARAPRVEVLNMRALLTLERGEPTPVTIHRGGRFIVFDALAVAFAAVSILAVVGFAQGYPGPAVPDPPPGVPPDAERLVVLEVLLAACCALVGGVPLLLLVVLLAWWPRGTGPLILLDREGVTIPHLRLAVPWSEVAHVDVAPPARSSPAGFWLQPHDPVEILSRSSLRGWRWAALRLWLRMNQRSVFLPAQWMREPPDAAVGAAWRLLHDHRERAAATTAGG